MKNAIQLLLIIGITIIGVACQPINGVLEDPSIITNDFSSIEINITIEATPSGNEQFIYTYKAEVFNPENIEFTSKNITVNGEYTTYSPRNDERSSQINEVTFQIYLESSSGQPYTTTKAIKMPIKEDISLKCNLDDPCNNTYSKNNSLSINSLKKNRDLDLETSQILEITADGPKKTHHIDGSGSRSWNLYTENLQNINEIKLNLKTIHTKQLVQNSKDPKVRVTGSYIYNQTIELN
jgi:hypothetical protein